jgi:hypothetical protein
MCVPACIDTHGREIAIAVIISLRTVMMTVKMKMVVAVCDIHDDEDYDADEDDMICRDDNTADGDDKCHGKCEVTIIFFVLISYLLCGGVVWQQRLSKQR